MITELEQAQAKVALAKDFKVAQKSMVVAVVLTLLLPLVGYLYTGRWKGMLLILGLAFLGGTLSGSADAAFGVGTVIGSIGGAIEQAIGIGAAQERVAAARAQGQRSH